LPTIGTVAYRISYRDALRLRRLVAVAESLSAAHRVIEVVSAALPEAADRLIITEDPLYGLASHVVTPPQTFDAAGGLATLYLGGTTSPRHTWQAQAIAALRAEPAVILNPRR
jgi:hypothetical protein